MKNLLTIALFVPITVFLSFTSKAADRNPWLTYNEVVRIFNTANGQFQNLSADEKNDFMLATEHIKVRLSHHNDVQASEKLKEVYLTESIFRFVWSSKDISEGIDVNMEIPKTPIAQ
jgi:hypothetical protein